MNRSRPRMAETAELDKSFVVHEFLAASRKASRGWEPARGDLVLVSVRVGVRMRAVFIGQEDRRGYGCWAWVILLGRVRSFPRQIIAPYTAAAETTLTPELARSIRWGFGRPA